MKQVSPILTVFELKRKVHVPPWAAPCTAKSFKIEADGNRTDIGNTVTKSMKPITASGSKPFIANLSSFQTFLI